MRPVLAAVLALTLTLAACGGDEETEPEDLGSEVAEQIEEADLDESECLLPDDVIEEATDDLVTQSGGSAGGSSGASSTAPEGELTYEVSYEGCDYLLESGGSINVSELVDTDGTTALESFEQIGALVGSEEDAQTITNLGDNAVQLSDELYLLVEDRAFRVAGERAIGEPFDLSTLEAIASALTEP